MHTFSTDKTIFHFNSDYSGDIIIIDKTTPDRREYRVDGEDLYSFAKLMITNDLISYIEQF